MNSKATSVSYMLLGGVWEGEEPERISPRYCFAEENALRMLG